MYLEHCKLTIAMWKQSKKMAEKSAIEYTERFWEKYIVITKECFQSYIVAKEVHRQYFIDKGLLKSEWVQLGFSF